MQKPAYSIDCINASAQEKPSPCTYTGTIRNWLTTSAATPSGNGSSQGSTQATTISRIEPRPLAL